VIAKISKGSSFGGILNYLFEHKDRPPPERELTQEEKAKAVLEALNQPEIEEASRVGLERVEELTRISSVPPEGGGVYQDMKQEARGVIIAGNMAGRNARELEREFKSLADLQPEVERRVFHCSISTTKEDNVTPERQARIAEKFTERLGLVNTMWVAVRHENEHGEFHLVASRINYDGKVISDAKDFERGEKIVRKLEREFKLSRHKSSWETMRRAPTQGEIKFYERTGQCSFRIQLQAEVDAALKRSLPLPEFKLELERRGIQWHLKVDEMGRVQEGLYGYEAKVIRARKLGHGYTFEGLQKDWPDQEHRAGRILYESERDYVEICRASRGEHELQDRGARPGATNILGRESVRNRAELSETASSRNRSGDETSGSGPKEFDKRSGRGTTGRQLEGISDGTRGASDEDRRPHCDIGTGEYDDGSKAGRPGISRRSDVETRPDAATADHALRGSVRQAELGATELARGYARRDRNDLGHMGETALESPEQRRRDSSADGRTEHVDTQANIPAHMADDRGEQLLEAVHLRYEGDGQAAPHRATQGQAAPTPAAERHQPVGPLQQLLEPWSEERADNGSVFDRVFKLIADATKPVIEREHQEASRLQTEAPSEAVKEPAVEVIKPEQQKPSVAPRLDLALNEINRRVDCQLQEMIRQDGLDCLSSPETIIHLSQAVEQSLSQRALKLADLRLTHACLTEQLSSYVELLANDPQPFLSRMEQNDSKRIWINESTEPPERTQTDEPDHDFEPSR